MQTRLETRRLGMRRPHSSSATPAFPFRKLLLSFLGWRRRLFVTTDHCEPGAKFVQVSLYSRETAALFCILEDISLLSVLHSLPSFDHLILHIYKPWLEATTIVDQAALEVHRVANRFPGEVAGEEEDADAEGAVKAVEAEAAPLL